jgi:uracil-DNA glycosylase
VESQQRIIVPVTSKTPTFFVVIPVSKGDYNYRNGSMKPCNYNATKLFLNVAKQYGFQKKHFYFCPANKIAHEKYYQKNHNAYYEPDKSEQHFEEYRHIIEEEIKIVKPTAIICLSGWHIRLFLDGKPKMSDLAGHIDWTHKYDMPILCEYSPQYCYFNQEEDRMDKLFDNLSSITLFT